MTVQSSNEAGPDGPSTRAAPAERIGIAAEAREARTERVLVEQAVTLTVDRVGSFTILCTPQEVQALAAGFALTEGMIGELDDIVAMTDFRPDSGEIAMEVSDPSRVVTRRNLVVTSSCGACGSRNVARLLSRTKACGDSMRLRPGVLEGLIEQMHEGQELFRATGAAHAAGLFDADGRIVTLAEDIGRHNAMDKAIGKCLLAGQAVRGMGAVLSGRVSFELVAKAAAVGLEVVAAVSAPSSLAVEAADACNITLCGFVRRGRATVYTHGRRIVGSPT